MASKKSPPKKKAAARRSAPPAPFPAAKRAMPKKKPKIPSLGGGMVGLGGTGAQGMMP